LYDDYRRYRKELNEEIHKNKRISTKVRMLETDLAKAKGDGNKGPKNKTKAEKEAESQEVSNLKL
jgi:uncharacterized protein YdaU (DUF1376 family)